MRALHDEDPGSIDMTFEWPTLRDGCETEIEDWLDGHPNAGLVVIDTLQRVRPQGMAYKTLYEMDYAACAPLADLAHRRGICVLIIHHTRKARKEDAGDPMERVSGTTGLTGSVDGSIVLVRKRNSSDGTLQLLHRGMPDTKYAITTDDETGIWTLVGEAPEADDDDEPVDAPITPEQRRYIDLIREHGQMRPKEVTAALGKPSDTVRKMLRKLVKRQLLGSSGGLYWVTEAEPRSDDESEPSGMATELPDSPVHTVHSGHGVHSGHTVDVDEGVHTVHSDHVSGQDLTTNGAPGVHNDPGVHTPAGSTAAECDHCELVNTPSDIGAVVPTADPDVDRVTSGPREREQVAAEDDIGVLSDPVPADVDQASKRQTPAEAPSTPDGTPRATKPMITDAARACGDYGPEQELGRRTPTSDIPFERGWRNPLALKAHEENISRRLDWDTGCRTKVSLTVDPHADDPGGRTVWLECGHGKIEEEVVYRPWWPTENRRGVDDYELIRMALAHHAYMCACDCIRALWDQYFDDGLTTASAEQALWSALRLMNRRGYYIHTRFHEPKWPPAPRWVEEPDETFDESEEVWPDQTAG